MLALLVVVAAATPALASWRCGSRLVDPGQSLEDVYDLCGEPTDRATFTELVTVHPRCGLAVTYPVVVETWTYDRGPRQFVRYLTFRDGRLVGIEEGGYGS